MYFVDAFCKTKRRTNKEMENKRGGTAKEGQGNAT